MSEPILNPETERPPLVLNREQIACMASPQKSELFEALMTLRAASIGELAAYLGRSAKSLYYHIRPLCAVGLVQVRETRLSGKRMEAVYETVSNRIVIEETEEDGEREQAARRSHRALLRKMERELRDASQEKKKGPTELDVLRISVWLTPEARAQLTSRLEDLARFLREQDDPEYGTRTLLTAFVTAYSSAESAGRPRPEPEKSGRNLRPAR